MSESDGDSWARPAGADARARRSAGVGARDRTAPRPAWARARWTGPRVDAESAAAFGAPGRGVRRLLRRGPARRCPTDSTVDRPAPRRARAGLRPPGGERRRAAAAAERRSRTAAPVDPALWSGADDPWRNPASTATLGPPPAHRAAPRHPRPRGEGARLSLREVLFGRRVQRRALAVLGLVALLVGAAGGLVGRLTADGASRLTEPGARLSTVTESKERPPGSVADIAARTVPAVVSLEVRVGEEAGTGSGIVIQSDGYVLTNNHVVAPAAAGAGSRLDAVFADGTRAPARIVGRDPKTDLAVVKVDVANPVVAAIGSSAGLAVGDARDRHRLPPRPRRHGHPGHRERAGPARPARRGRLRRGRGDRRHPDRRRDQPRQLRWPAGRLHRRRDRHQHARSAASAPRRATRAARSAWASRSRSTRPGGSPRS